ncbi:monocarboxylate permease, putative [Talaromyces stipitatus ATCC 10500]|uniref:Monocarboxylate permease, putative n=1 Tax=Talaromyces stipitatus (strain ATCC 10500 / CBS 375.48 / QM 6759 / NRRL 1006) TaxID=441959 RepID=B8MKZ9_TALSN|nr:monocarboxylate permease, putative [Talaromyces stipitatus ATCC 10500]EED15415.1 monocarboxylate permease, putative [Talaromyces stipitatus ATCC 10500]
MSLNDLVAFDEKPAETKALDGVLQTTDEENNDKNGASTPKESTHSVLLAQGFCVGIGCRLTCVLSTAILSQYLSTKIATAVGFTSAGSSFGGIIYAIVFHKSQPSIGLPWATRVIGFVILATQLIAVTVYKVRVLPENKRAVIYSQLSGNWYTLS